MLLVDMVRRLGARDAAVAAARAVGSRHAEAAGRAAVPAVTAKTGIAVLN